MPAICYQYRVCQCLDRTVYKLPAVVAVVVVVVIVVVVVVVVVVVQAL